MNRPDSRYQTTALIWSGVFHLIMLLLVIVGLPEFWKQHRESLPMAMSVEIVPISELTNIKKQAAQKKEQKKPEEKAVAKKAVSESSSNQKSDEEKKKIVAPPTPSEEPIPQKVEKPKEEKPKEEPKPQEKQEKKEDFESVLKSIETAAKKEEGDKPKKANEELKTAKADDYNPSLPMSMTEIDAIRSQFVKCWNIPAGARDAHELKVVIDVTLREDGSVIEAKLGASEGRYYQDGFFRAAADSAIRAVYRCSPLKNLPSNKYETWKYLQMNFDPKDMLY